MPLKAGGTGCGRRSGKRSGRFHWRGRPSFTKAHLAAGQASALAAGFGEVDKRLIKLYLNGNVLLEINGINPNSLAVDTRTGDVWVLTGEGIIYGKNLIVLNPSGHRSYLIERTPTKS